MSHCIGIDLTTDALRLVHVARRRDRLSVLGAYTRPLESGGLPDDADGIRVLLSDSIRQAGFPTNATIVVGLPHEKVFFHGLTTDMPARAEARRLLQFESEDDFPVPFDELVVDVCGHGHAGEGRYEYLVAAAARRELNPWVQALDTSGRRDTILSADACALDALARSLQLPEETTCVLLHADGYRAILGLWREGSLVCARHWSCTGDSGTLGRTLGREIELTWRSSGHDHRRSEVNVLLSGPDHLVPELSEKLSQATGRQVRPIQLSTAVPATKLDGGFTIALGLALLGLHAANGRLNFLHADPDRLDRAARSTTKRAALVSAILLAVIAGLLGFRTWKELNTLRAEHTRVSRDIRTIFVAAFPGEKKIVNELAQMTEHLDALRKQRDVLAAAVGQPIRPLWLLQVLSETLASDVGVRVSSFVATGGTIRIAGTGQSFESIEQLLEALRHVPQFGSVELEDVASSRGSDRPGFRLVISVRAG